MKSLIASHTHNIYLKPGEVFVSQKPALIATVLGSCVAVTIFSPSTGLGAICHAMLPENFGRSEDFRYLDNAMQHLFRSISKGPVKNDLVVKLFGGAQVMDIGCNTPQKLSIGEQNVAKAEEIISSLGFTISARDTGGLQGRKLFFCTRSGEVYVRHMRGRLSKDEDIIL